MLTEPDPELEALYAQLRDAPPGADTSELEAKAIARYLALPRATTPSGLPYPAPTDPISQGASAIQALAQAVEVNRIIGYAFTTGNVTLPGTASFAAIAFATLSFSVVAGQKYAIRAVASVNNAASGNPKTATLRLVENGAAPNPIIQGTFSSPFVVGSSANSCQITGVRTAAASGVVKYDLQGYASAASSVSVSDCEFMAVNTL